MSPTLKVLATPTCYFFDLITLDTSEKWNPAVFVFLSNWLISLSLASKFLLNDTIKRIQIKYAKICSWLWVAGLNMVFKNSFYFSLFSNYVDVYFLSNTQVTHFPFFLTEV